MPIVKKNLAKCFTIHKDYWRYLHQVYYKTIESPDRRDENILIVGIQKFLRRECGDEISSVKSFRYNSPRAIQRIGDWGSILR